MRPGPVSQSRLCPLLHVWDVQEPLLNFNCIWLFLTSLVSTTISFSCPCSGGYRGGRKRRWALLLYFDMRGESWHAELALHGQDSSECSCRAMHLQSSMHPSRRFATLFCASMHNASTGSSKWYSYFILIIHATGGSKREAEEAGILSPTLTRAVIQIVEGVVGRGMCLHDLNASKYCTVAYKRFSIYDFLCYTSVGETPIPKSNRTPLENVHLVLLARRTLYGYMRFNIHNWHRLTLPFSFIPHQNVDLELRMLDCLMLTHSGS